MKIPISKRLLCCAGFVEPGARVADIGTDHGYLGIYLLKNGIARQVTACDLRPLPLRNAQENAERFGVGAQMEFLLSDGLERVTPDRIDTVVCAGMGGDLIVAECQRVLSEEYPELSQKLRVMLPDEEFRRVGQSMAAASLPGV